MESLGFYVCVADLEDELIRSLGRESVEEVIEAHGELRGSELSRTSLRGGGDLVMSNSGASSV